MAQARFISVTFWWNPADMLLALLISPRRKLSGWVCGVPEPPAPSEKPEGPSTCTPPSGDNVPHLHVHLLPRYPGTPHEYWWQRVDEWPDAPRGGHSKAAAMVERLRLHYSLHYSDEAPPSR
ncbi:hypothetical protein E4K10_44375 [Streptomyces sp. T1317-0309]|nr:hypothetical protein E4K10_44375 [Streptomyces sp. T1317-0309]